MTAAQRRRLEQRRPPIAAMPHNGQPEKAVRPCELREIGRQVRTGESGPVPAELNMTALHATVAQDAGRGEWRTVGCAVGVAMALIPKAVRERYRGTAQGRDSRPCIYEIIGRTLGMDPVTTGSLLFGLGSGREKALEKITPTEVCAAIGRVLAGRLDFIWRRSRRLPPG